MSNCKDHLSVIFFTYLAFYITVFTTRLLDLYHTVYNVSLVLFFLFVLLVHSFSFFKFKFKLLDKVFFDFYKVQLRKRCFFGIKRLKSSQEAYFEYCMYTIYDHLLKCLNSVSRKTFKFY